MTILEYHNAGRIPSARILKKIKDPVYGIIHFSMNTYTDKEWGYGDEKPEIFNPVHFDADQIAGACKEGGLSGLIIVCKHHDGFCLWPTKTTPHNISASPWKQGKGDMVGELSAALRRAGLQVGFYVSPWDRNHPLYGTPEYLKVYREQIRELCTWYGKAFEMWFDGANGGDGWYGGKREIRKIDASCYYDWLNTWKIVRRLQPDAVIFSDIGPDVRWAGNESGFIDSEAYASYTPHAGKPGIEPAPGLTVGTEGTFGHADGKYFIPAEADFPLRPGWFYHPAQDGMQRSAATLLHIYLNSVGCSAFMNIGIAPDRSGRMTEDDCRCLREFKAAVDSLYRNGVFHGSFPVENGMAQIPLKDGKKFNFLQISEDVSKGEGILGYTLEAHTENGWKEILRGKAVGFRRLKRIAAVRCDSLRFRITELFPGVKVGKIGLAGFMAPSGLLDSASGSLDLTERKDYFRLPELSAAGDTAEWHLEGMRRIKGFVFTPVFPAGSGTPARYEFSVKDPSGNWKTVSEGEFSNIKANPIPQVITFSGTAECSAVRLRMVRGIYEGDQTLVMKEFALLLTDGSVK